MVIGFISTNENMATPSLKRKRDFQEIEYDTDDDFSPFVFGTCGLSMKRRRKNVKPPLPFPKIEKDLNQEFGKENDGGAEFTPWKPAYDIQPVFTPQPFKRNSKMRASIQRKVSISVMRKKMKQFQDYSLPFISDFEHLQKISSIAFSRRRCRVRKDHDLQQKIDHEIKMREGTAKLLAASKHPAQMLEAAKSLLTSNTRIMSYMTELQKRKTAEVLGRNTLTEGNQLPCKSTLCASDIRIPLMWKDTDHFKNKGDYRRYAVFCLLRVGTDIYDTSMISNVDRSMTDLTFDDVIVFENVPHDFQCKLEVYCHKLHEDLTIASTPKKLRKKINDLSGSVGRSVGKRLSGLNDSDIIGNMVLGPRFELVATGTMELTDVGEFVNTFDLRMETVPDGTHCELPLFGHYCCRLAAVPHCLVQPAVTGYLNVQEDDDLSMWKRYYCILKNLHMSCWPSPEDVEVTEPLLTIPVTKNTQISDADPRTCKRSHTFHVKTTVKETKVEYTLAADTKAELSEWWDGLQQHLIDQALWKHACDEVLEIKAPTRKHRNPVFTRKSSIYDDTPLEETSSTQLKLVGDLKNESDQLSQMLNTLMGEAKQIRGDSCSSSSSSVS